MPRRTALVAVLVTIVILAIAGCVLWSRHTAAQPLAQPPVSVGTLRGVVLDEAGHPLAAAEVTPVDGRVTTTKDDGSFTISGTRPRVVTVSAAGYLPRAVALAADTPRRVILSRAAGTVSFRFGGDVMFGRRFYDPNEDGDLSDALISANSASSHAALLSHVKPFLSDADVTVVNFESPILSNPPTGLEKQRDGRLQQTKDYVFASAPASGQGLKQSGVDVVDLGNNHVFDGGESGMKQTIEVLDAAGIKHFGAGLDEASAWRPLFLTSKGQRFAFIGCTTITGEDQLTTYVAAGNKGGAAKCEASRLSAAVADARAQQASVIVMIHGGYEYVRTMSPAVEQLTEAAAHAGAFAVINGHPHVIGAIRHVASTLVADTMGNLLFDQTVWPTYPSYVLRLDVSDGQVKRTAADPIWHEQFVPRPTTGHLADVAARIAAGAPDAAVADTGADADSAASKLEVDLSLPARQVVVLPPGVTLTSSPSPSLRAGRDLLFSGGFEDLDTDVSTRGALGWDLGRGSRLSGDAACDGSIGVTMTAISGRTSVLHPRLHQLVAGGQKLTLVADIARLEGQAELVVSWFPDTRGPSNGATRMKVPAVGPQCRQARLDVTVPNGVVAAEPSVELHSAVGSPAHLDVDNVRLVAWSTTPALGDDVVDSGTATPVKVLRP